MAKVDDVKLEKKCSISVPAIELKAIKYIQ
jgi:hypothetical protein